MLLGFKPRFEPLVKDGSKRHTLRDPRGGDRPVRVGDRLDCYGDSRQKTMHLIGRWLCVRKQEFRVTREPDIKPGDVAFFPNSRRSYRHTAYIAGLQLAPDECDAFAWADGFRYTENPTLKTGCFLMMMDYWYEQRPRVKFPMVKELIHWDFDKPMEKPAK